MTIPTQVAELKIDTVATPDPIDLTSEDGALYFLNAADLRVRYRDPDGNETDWFIGDDYTVSGAGSLGEGVLTPVSPTAAGGLLCIWRATPLVQEADYEEDDGFPAKTQEREMDRQVLMIQDLARLIARAVRLCDCDPPLDPLPCGSDPLADFAAFAEQPVTGSIVQLTFEADNFGDVLPIEWKRKTNIGFGCAIVAWSIQTDVETDITFDVRMKAFATDDPPTIADTIVAAAPPTMHAHSDFKSTALTGWNTTVAIDTAVEVEITACSDATWAVLNLYLRRGAPLDA